MPQTVMASKQRTARDRSPAENAALRARLAEAEETLRAIREGEVDAVIVSGSKGDRVFALSEAENLPRVMVETMNEVGLAIAPDGLIVFCNNRASVLLHRTKDRLLGHNVADFVAPEDAGRFRKLVRAATTGNADARITFISETGSLVPMHVWASHLRRPEGPLISLVGTDLSRIEADQTLIAQLTEQKRQLNESRQTALDLKDEAVRARKEMERINAALRASEERIQQALQVGRSFTFDWHPPSDKVVRSSSCATILGMSGPKACRGTGKEYLNRVQPDDRARLLKAIGSLTPKANSYTLEYRFNRDDGQVVVIEETGRGTFDAAGGLARVVGVSSDISARRNAEEAAREATRALRRERDILHHVMSGAKNCHLVFLDRDFNFVYVNETYARSCGYSVEEMIGKNLFGLYPNPENEAIFKRVRDSGEPAEFNDVPFVFPEQPERGTTYWDWTLVPVMNQSNEVFGMVFSLIETTNRERTELALRASGERMRLVLQASAMGTFEVDLATGRSRWNAMEFELLGLRPGDVVPDPQNFFRFVHPDDLAQAKQRWQEALKKGTMDTEFRIIRPDGEVRWLGARGQYIVEGSDDASARQSLRFMGVHFDITENKRAEDELRKLNARLESRVRARTAEVERQREDLRRLACRIASVQDEEQRRIAEGLHDGVAQLLVTGTLKLAQWSDSTSSRKSKQAILEIEGLIFEALKSIRTMTFDFAAATLAQLGLAKALEELCLTMTERHGIHFAFECRGEMRRLTKQSATVLFKAAREMMFNVIKHADVKKATVTITNRRGECRVTIEDHGKGFKARPGEAVGHHPAGIGILSVMERMRNIGGRVTIKAAPGTGTKVSLILPAPRTKKRQNGVARP